MPDDLIKYSEAIRDAEAPTLDTTDVFALAKEDNSSPTGYTSFATKLLAIANKILKGIDYSSDLKTTANNPIGAINEINGTWLTGTLTAGNTSITFNDASIDTTSTIDVYTDTFGVNPTNMVATSAQLVLTFPAQASDISVKVRVL